MNQTPLLRLGQHRPSRIAFSILFIFSLAVGLIASLGFVQGQQVHRNGFEGREPVWIKGAADAPFRETAHETTDLTAHTGQLSEHIQLTAESGKFIYYTYNLGRAPISDELTASVWVKANRPGVQLLARLVLPNERAANNVDERLTTVLRGDLYQNVGRWQRLEVRRPIKLAKEQQQLMRAEMQRDVDFRDAFIDRVMLNVYGGPGKTDVWIDDLEVGPLLDAAPFQPTSRPTGPGKDTFTTLPQTRTRAGVVELKQDHLVVGGKRFFLRGIRHSDTPLEVLREAGFNTVWFDFAAPPATLEEAVNLGFWIVPSLPVSRGDARLTAADGVRSEVARFLVGDAVLFWDLGGGLVEEESPAIFKSTQLVRSADPQRPVGADVWDGLGAYSRNVDMVGVHRWPLMTGLELPQYRQWLEQRRLLARPESFVWTWVQTHLPDWYTTLVYNRPSAAGFDEPIGPQPEQIRLLTYVAIGAGCHGLGFWSDRFLANSHQGRDRLLMLALLNLELQMLEPLLVSADAPKWVDVFQTRPVPGSTTRWADSPLPEVKAAVMRTEHGVLVLPMWLGKGAQFVPGQEAAAQISIVVPAVPPGTQAWEISPAEVRTLETERVPGGTKVRLPEFGLTGAIVFTADNSPTGVIVRLQDQLRRMRKLAAQYNYQLAQVELEKVNQVETQLEAGGHTLPDGQDLLKNARSRLVASSEYWHNGDFRQAYLEAERSMRAVRILMRAQWEQATRGLDTPVASPYAVSFFTLPRHWQFMEPMRQASVGANVLPDGGFEASANQTPAWSLVETKLDAVQLNARRVTENAKEGRQCLLLEIKAQDPKQEPAALERTFLALKSSTVRLQPGTRVRVSGWVRIPKPITASADGALLYDSAGGEPLGLRLVDCKEWKKFTLYREVPASGAIDVTVALTGLGQAFFDDIRIEPLILSAATASPPRN